MKARLPKGYGGGPQNQKDMIRQAQKFQEQLAQKQAELDEREYTAVAGGGVVEAVVTGKKQIKSLKIKPEIVDSDDIDMLEDTVCAAINEALRIADEATTEEMNRLTGSLNLPGMPGIF